MSVIRVDPDRIRNGRDETGKRQRELRQELAELKSEAGALGGFWSGEAASRFETRMLEGLASFEKICSDLEKLYEWENRILMTVTREEKKAGALVDKAAV